jgi:hypothetical protein
LDPNHDIRKGFEWDEAKSERTHEERGFDFEFAAHIFAGNYLADEDRRANYGEPRYIAIGEVESLILTVVWTPRGQNRRIIAAWPASNQERRKYREHRALHKRRDPQA